jgi:hypothetical protein
MTGRGSRVVARLAWAAASGAGIAACCVPMYGDPESPCSAPHGKAMSAAESERIRKGSIAAARRAGDLCLWRVHDLVGGAVFVAEGDRSPRAHELLEHECGPPAAPGEPNPHLDPALRDTNPALCARLAAAPPPPEAFTLRKEGGIVYFVYFSYDEAGKLRVRDVYTKVAVNFGDLYFSSPPVVDADCPIDPAADARDLGVAPIWWPHSGHSPCWGGNSLNIGDVQLPQPDTNRVMVTLCYEHILWFRRSRAPLEDAPDGG